MPAYAIAFLRYKDAAAYHRYSNALSPMLPAYGAVLLAGDNQPAALAGAPCDRVVLLRFDDTAAALRLFESAEYLQIARNRDLGADVELQLVSGVS